MQSVAVQVAPCPELIKRLIAGNCDVDTPTATGWTPFLSAVAGGHCESVKLLAGHPGVDIKRQLPGGVSALGLAVRRGDQAMVEVLIKVGVNVDGPDDDGWTALHCAVAGEG